jgi:hypothetical protein
VRALNSLNVSGSSGAEPAMNSRMLRQVSALKSGIASSRV